MSRLLKVGVRINKCEITGEIDIKDDATPEEIEAKVREWVLEWWHEDPGAGERRG